MTPPHGMVGQRTKQRRTGLKFPIRLLREEIRLGGVMCQPLGVWYDHGKNDRRDFCFSCARTRGGRFSVFHQAHMSVVGQFTAFERARDDAFWSLLAAHTAPEILTALDAIFPEGGGPVPTARVVERLHATLEQLRAMNARMDATAQVYLAQWRTSGWITRDLPAGAVEEVYELSAASVQALRVARSAIAPRAINTESRLAMVLEQIDSLATDTDTNPETRLARLRADRDALDREIAAVERREFHTMPDDRALERVRQILGMTSGLMADFRTVRDEFAALNRELRRQLVESAASRPQVLEQLFSGMDLIGASPAGQSFDAFWRLLQDQGERARIMEATAAILGRPFAGALSTAERYALQDLLRTLLTESRVVYDVRQGMARNLKAFVESKEFLEQRRVMQLLS
jgi:Protein of unknown function (DUF3375)